MIHDYEVGGLHDAAAQIDTSSTTLGEMSRRQRHHLCVTPGDLCQQRRHRGGFGGGGGGRLDGGSPVLPRGRGEGFLYYVSMSPQGTNLAEPIPIRRAQVFAQEECMDNIIIATDCLSVVQPTRSSSTDQSTVLQ
jgi:hypothetical protein